MKQTIFLGSPEYYKSETKPVDPEKAKEQWQRLKSQIETHHITVKVVHSLKPWFDNVYITDTAIIINDFAIMAKFHKVSRRGEEKFTADYLKNKMGLRLRYLPDEEGVYFEGGGDTKWSHNFTHIWFGYGGGRSTLKGLEAVEKILKEELGPKCPQVHKLRIEDRKTFHLDLAFLPLPTGCALYYPTLSLAAIKEIESVFGKQNTIKVPTKYFFACNSVCLNENTLLAPKLPYEDYKQWMSKATQMKIDEVNVNQFHLGNGSIQCMVLGWIRI
jgi:N-dimethylarginine dimethylaminohydrolase